MEKGDSVKTADKDTSLTSDFVYPLYDDWKESAIRLLKGKNFDKALKTRTYEGITLDPIYEKKDLEGLEIDSVPGRENFLRGQSPEGNLGEGWGICQRMGSGIPEGFNRELLSDLDSGQNIVFISADTASSAGNDPDTSLEGEVAVNGLSLSVLKDISDALKNIDLEKYPIIFDTNVSGVEFLMLLEAHLHESGTGTDRINFDLNMDPLGSLAENGKLNSPPEHYYKKMALLIRRIKDKGLNGRISGVSVLPYHNAGASAVQELAIALSTGVEYIEALKNFGVSPADSAPSISFRFGVGSDFFMEIAKLRAGRVLWNRLQKEYGIEEVNRRFFVHSETSMFNQSSLDPYVNMLRITTEAFSAAAGGADCITINPFDRVLSPSGTFSRRVARNVHMVLKEESHLHKIIDPAGGSYFVEKLTSDLIEKVWDFFLEIEKQGGITKALENGIIRERISEGKEKLEKMITTRKKVMVGTNNYANPDEQITEKDIGDASTLLSQRINELSDYQSRMESERADMNLNRLKNKFDKEDPGFIDVGAGLFRDGATIGEISSLLSGDEEPFTIKGNAPAISRLPEKMERLRKKVSDLKEISGSRFEILIAVHEPFMKIKPRGDFAKSFFETGGLNSRLIRLKGDTSDKVKQIVDSGDRIVILCAADTDYQAIVPQMVPLIKKKVEKAIVVLAGDPGDNREFYMNNGTDFFIYRGIRSA